MSLPEETVLLLSAYADGELEDDERIGAEALLRESHEARAFVASLALLGQAVRAADSVDAPAPVDLTDTIMAAVARLPEATASDPAAPAQVRSLSAERAKRARRSQLVLAVGALAVAAAGLFTLRSRGLLPHGGEVAQTSPSALSPPTEKGVEVRDIDSDEKSQVSVFYLPAGVNMASSVVVWIDEKGAP